MHRRTVAAAVCAVALVALAVPTVSAGPPDRGSWSGEGDDVDATTCGFAVTIHWAVAGDYTVFYDRTATSMTMWIEQDVEQDTFTANGRTLIGLPYRFTGKTVLDPDGDIVSMVASGVLQAVPLPDGSVYRSAGHYDFLTDEHTGLTGDTESFCAALAP